MNLILIMKALAGIGIVLNLILMAYKGAQLAKTPEGQENIKFGLQPKNFIVTSIVGFVANFFDTLGIGSFAPSAAAFKMTGAVDDVNVPGVLNAGDTVPVCLEAFLFFTAFNVDPLTCFLMCLVATVGAFVSAGIVNGWDRQKVRWGFGAGLLVLALIMLCKQQKVGPFAGAADKTDPALIGTVEGGVKYNWVEDSGGNMILLDNKEYKEIKKAYPDLFDQDGKLLTKEQLASTITTHPELKLNEKGDNIVGRGYIAGVGLTGIKFIIALIINFFLGAAMSLGVGLYAPCMALCVLVGLHTGMAFPIMMGSCAYLMAFGNGPKFIMAGRYDIVACWTQAIFGAAGVFVAYYVVKSLPLTTLTWIVIVVCFITSILYFKDAIQGSKKEIKK